LRLVALGPYDADEALHVRRMRVVRAAIALGVVFVLGTVGFYLITHESYSLLECLYMTVITVSTVGFREVIPPRESETLIVFTIFLTMFGVGTGLYFFTALASMVVENDLPHRFWRRRMEKKIQSLNDHIIVVGAGSSGGHVVRELFHAGSPFLVVERDPSRIAALTTELHMDFPFVVGDGLEDSTLLSAGIETARGLMATLHEDRDNLYLCLSARQLNPQLRLVAKADDRSSFEKFERIGVNAVVSPSVMGGRHLASEMLRPDVASFVDGLLRVTESAPALSELEVGDGAAAAGNSLAEADLRSRTNCLILGIRDNSDSFYTYNPGPEVCLKPGSSVIALGDPVALESLRNLLRSGD
jgi:voltage-gated potassium channel